MKTPPRSLGGAFDIPQKEGNLNKMSKKERQKMVWNVYADRYGKLEIYNVFEHCGFRESVYKLMDKKLPKEEFFDKLKNEVVYYFWCKVEYELTVSHYPTYMEKEEIDAVVDERLKYNRDHDEFPFRQSVVLEGSKRIDICDQIRLNWHVFAEYVWSKI